MRIFEVLDAKPTILDPRTPVAAEDGTSLVFEDVHFRYDDGAAEVLRGIDLPSSPARRWRSSARSAAARPH